MSTTDHSEDFKQMVADAGLPTTEAEAKTMWEEAATEAESPFSNNSEYSPFWRTVVALVTKPVLWIVNNLLLASVLPNMFLKTATGTFLDMFGWAVDTPKKEAEKAQGVLTFSRVETIGEVEIPVGTEVQSPPINGKVYSLFTLSAVVLEDGNGSIDVAAEADEVGAGYNLPADYYTVLPALVPGIDAVTNGSEWLTSAGADEESPEDYRLRIRNQFPASNQYHTDAVYTRLITEFANVNTRNVFFEHDAPRGPGTANAYILMDVGQPSVELLASIEAYIMDQGNHGHGDDMQVFAMPEVDYILNVTFRATALATEDEIVSLGEDLEGAVAAAFRANDQYAVTTTQPLSTFSFSRLTGELHNLFPLLAAVQFDLADIDSALNIPRLTTLTVALDA